MPYEEFSFQVIHGAFGIFITGGALFAGISPASVPAWLEDQLAQGRQSPPVSEKARSELLVSPILLACREQSGNEVAVFSGARLDVSPGQGLSGECDFLLARAPSVPMVQAPVLAVVEAKKGDIQGGLGECLAQMLGARMLNERDGLPLPAIHGCVTTGEDWQFMTLRDSTAWINDRRYYLSYLPEILEVLAEIVRPT